MYRPTNVVLQRIPEPTPKSTYVGGLKQFESNNELF